MTVVNTSNRVLEAGDGIETDFDFAFKVFLSTDLKVYKVVRATGVATLQTLSTDYSVSINAITEGGTVTYVSAPLSTEDSLILREVPLTQSTAYPPESNLPEKTFENSLDKLTMAIQQIDEILGRSITLPVSSELSDLEIPTPSAGKALKWNATADGLTNTTYDPDEQALIATSGAAASAASAVASAASAAAAAISETNADASATAAAASAATINLPSIVAGDAGKGLIVNTGETGYAHVVIITGAGTGLTKNGDVLDIATSGVATSMIKDLNVTKAKIGADAIDGTKIEDDAVGAEHIDFGTGAGEVNTDELPEGSTNKYFSPTVYTGVSNEETNTTLGSVDIRNKWIRIHAFFEIGTDLSAIVPGGAGDNYLSGSIYNNGTIAGGQAFGHTDMSGYTTDLYCSGILYTESGIAAPAGAAAYSNPALLLFDASADAAHDFDTDVFIYVDSTTGYLTLHIGTCAGAKNSARYAVVAELLS